LSNAKGGIHENDILLGLWRADFSRLGSLSNLLDTTAQHRCLKKKKTLFNKHGIATIIIDSNIIILGQFGHCPINLMIREGGFEYWPKIIKEDYYFLYVIFRHNS